MEPSTNQQENQLSIYRTMFLLYVDSLNDNDLSYAESKIVLEDNLVKIENCKFGYFMLNKFSYNTIYSVVLKHDIDDPNSEITVIHSDKKDFFEMVKSGVCELKGISSLEDVCSFMEMINKVEEKIASHKKVDSPRKILKRKFIG